MQRVLYQIKRGAIFLVLWLVVSGLVAGGLFALICYTAGAELPTWLEKEGGTATDLFSGLWALALEAFVLTYLFKDMVCRRFHLTRRQKYWAISGLYVFFYVAIPALYTALEYCLGVD
jgi:hypothetical protein